MRILRPRRVAPRDLRLAPLAARGLAPVEGGIDLGREELGPIEDSGIFGLSAFELWRQGQGELRLVLFLRGRRRPYVVPATGIRYLEFDLSPGGNTADHLREFLLLLVDRVPDLCVETESFFRGAAAQVVEDPVTLVTAWAMALKSENKNASRPAEEGRDLFEGDMSPSEIEEAMGRRRVVDSQRLDPVLPAGPWHQGETSGVMGRLTVVFWALYVLAALAVAWIWGANFG